MNVLGFLLHTGKGLCGKIPCAVVWGLHTAAKPLKYFMQVILTNNLDYVDIITHQGAPRTERNDICAVRNNSISYIVTVPL